MSSASIGVKWTEGTGFTENGVIVDGRLTKLGGAALGLRRDAPMQPWHAADPGGLDMVLTPFSTQTTKVAAASGAARPTRCSAVVGRFFADDGPALDFGPLQGFAEEARQHW
jgi:hypothetical protein